MKSHALFRNLILFIFLFAFVSCKKYEEGPFISLRSKINRIEGKWKFQKFIDHEYHQDLTSDFKDGLVNFKKNGDYEFSDGYYYILE